MGGQSRSVSSQVLVFLAAAAYLGWGVWQVPLASGYTDPIQQVRPQDEALYSSIAIGMAGRGEWLTPRFLGRLAFVKPILAFLPPALAVRAFGPSLWSLRLFAVLCGAAALTLLWRWQGPAAALLLAANPLFFLLARRNMTDVPVLCAVLLTLYLWSKSPAAAGAALAWGVLTKSVAGAIPALILWKGWPRPAAAAVLLVLPWHLYQLAVNGEWYWKEHILDEHLHWGLSTPENAAADPHLAFYASRAWAIDPVLALLAPLALAYVIYRRNWLPAAWLAISAAVLFAFGYRNATYLLPVFAAAALAAARLPWPLAAALLAARLLAGSISHAPAEPVPPLAALLDYQSLGRPNGLILDGVADELVASTLSLPRVQYMLPGDTRTLAPTNIDFPGRGIIVPAASYANLPEPRETVLLVQSPQQIQLLLDTAATRDFLLRTDRLPHLNLGRRLLRPARNGWTAALAVP
jgi:hypothetical protein